MNWFKKINIDNPMFTDFFTNMSIDKFVEMIIPETNLVFVPMPNSGKPWNDKIIRAWNRDWKLSKGPAEDNFHKYLPYYIRGTTFSGIP